MHLVHIPDGIRLVYLGALVRQKKMLNYASVINIGRLEWKYFKESSHAVYAAILAIENQVKLGG